MSTKDQTEGYVQNMWYSWNHGMAHFVQINTETDFPSAPEHVYSGPFGANGHASTNCTACGNAFESLMVKYNVDVVWAGHVHYYERDTPIANGVPDPKGLNNLTGPW
ncbi:hypothetical protein CDV55_102577 [Aspergillus turcosus]|nr:hypothetical protein CDV55_102577 [Aspergillus turcosus]